MTPYAAFLRGVSPSNAKMPELRAAFEAAGFSDVRTVLSSGNLVFRAPRAGEPALARRAEAAMEQRLGTAFSAVIRPVDALRALLDSDPYQGFRLAPGAKRVVTFLRQAPKPAPALPVEQDGARILRLDGSEAFSAYVPSPRGPVFMQLIERTFGKSVTTRTWETVKKVVAASER
jgi:uncharacterized protein (DUF1697 family)